MSHVENETPILKVVIPLRSELIKGYVKPEEFGTNHIGLFSKNDDAGATLHIRRLDADSFEGVSIEGAKAIFFVKSFDGDLDHKTLHFHSRAPVLPGIWLRLEFVDGEVMEGIVDNTIDYLVNPGFYLYPSDPGSNNQLVYVMKGMLKNARILGLRPPCPDWCSPGTCSTLSEPCLGHLLTFNRSCPHKTPLFKVESPQTDTEHEASCR